MPAAFQGRRRPPLQALRDRRTRSPPLCRSTRPTRCTRPTRPTHRIPRTFPPTLSPSPSCLSSVSGHTTGVSSRRPTPSSRVSPAPRSAGRTTPPPTDGGVSATRLPKNARASPLLSRRAGSDLARSSRVHQCRLAHPQDIRARHQIRTTMPTRQDTRHEVRVPSNYTPTVRHHSGPDVADSTNQHFSGHTRTPTTQPCTNGSTHHRKPN